MKRLAVGVAGAIASVVLGAGWAAQSGEAFVAPLEKEAKAAIADAGGRGVNADFSLGGWPTRHPLLAGGDALDKATRLKVAWAVARLDGVGGVRWAASPRKAGKDPFAADPLHCQQSVEGLLKTRSIRFAEGSSALLPASRVLLDEVAAALRPCRGAIIAIEGHTDRLGGEPANLALSMERARAVREALVARGLERGTLYARGLGSDEPVAGLEPADPANRRIEFSVIRKQPLIPTPVDTPGAY